MYVKSNNHKTHSTILITEVIKNQQQFQNPTFPQNMCVKNSRQHLLVRCNQVRIRDFQETLARVNAAARPTVNAQTFWRSLGVCFAYRSHSIRNILKENFYWRNRYYE